MNPKKFGKLANHKQEPWKVPLPIFIEDIYRKRFGKDKPDDVRPLEQILTDRKQKKAEKKVSRRAEFENPPATSAPSEVSTEIEDVPF